MEVIARGVLGFLVHSDLEARVGAQVQLAARATCEEVRLMHEELEQLYRTQLGVALTARRIAPSIRP